jgi:hypothetical protein
LNFIMRIRGGRREVCPVERIAPVGSVRLALGLLLAVTFAQVPNSPAELRKGGENLLDLVDARARVEGSMAPIQIRVGPMEGWDRAFTISNGKVEALIVPGIGRVMQFRMVGANGPFWEDPALRGRVPDPASAEWLNFGGDKTWPAPQADWGTVTPRQWPPPIAFDAMPVEMSVRRDALVMTSPVDPHYGIRTERVVELEPGKAVMKVTTIYTKVEGAPVRVGIWIITQLRDPVGVYARVPARSLFSEGYGRQFGEVPPAGLSVHRGVLSLTRHRQQATKIGMDTDRLVWVGETQVMRIDSPRIPGAEYPDEQSSAEIYTNPDPKAYVELEMLGPLHLLKQGDQISQTNRYTLSRRTSGTPERDALRALSSNQAL